MCNKGPINTPINPNRSGTESSNSGTITANVGNVGSLDNGGNATAVTHIEVHPPNPDMYDNGAKFEVFAANTDKKILAYIMGVVIFILVLMLISGAIAWYCSNMRDPYHENLQTADRDDRNHGPSSRYQPRRSHPRSGRDDVAMPLRVYNIPPSYAEVFQNHEPQAALELPNSHQPLGPVASDELTQPTRAPHWRRSARHENIPIVDSDGKRMIYC
jgi:hypothetical protein